MLIMLITSGILCIGNTPQFASLYFLSRKYLLILCFHILRNVGEIREDSL